jgi:SAM-dependent methyltransferase
MMVSVSAGPAEVTLASYQAAAQRYRDQAPPRAPALRAFLDRLAELAGSGLVLELGSGPGSDATYLESLGVRVIRTDATPAFVEMMRADGHEARLLDVRHDDLAGPYHAVVAIAVLLHLTRRELREVLTNVSRAVVDGGLLGFTLKEGDGEAWSHAKLNLPRHFTYWREPDIRTGLEASGWSVLSVEHVMGRHDPWLHVLAQNRSEPSPR